MGFSYPALGLGAKPEDGSFFVCSPGYLSGYLPPFTFNDVEDKRAGHGSAGSRPMNGGGGFYGHAFLNEADAPAIPVAPPPVGRGQPRDLRRDPTQRGSSAMKRPENGDPALPRRPEERHARARSEGEPEHDGLDGHEVLDGPRLRAGPWHRSRRGRSRVAPLLRSRPTSRIFVREGARSSGTAVTGRSPSSAIGALPGHGR